MEILDANQGHSRPDDGPSLEQLHKDGFVFNFSEYFETGWSILKQDVGGYISFLLVAMLILVVSLITIIGPIFIALPLFAGFITMSKAIYTGEERTFNTFFKGFESFGPLVGYTFLYILVSGIISLPFLVPIISDFPDLIELAESDPYGFQQQWMLSFWPMMGYSFIVSALLQALLFFVMPLIIIGKLPVFDAITWSIKLSLKNFWWILLYSFVVGLIAQAGVYACYIGMLFTIPLGETLKMGVYLKVIGPGSKNGINA
ncbi:MAG: hypothetical protein RL226_1440 [Bacteroidota bacterium]